MLPPLDLPAHDAVALARCGQGALSIDVLGAPGEDNAVLATLDSGQRITRHLFDCGAGCLDGVRFRDLQQIDALYFSHFHMDHISGFDAFVRANYAREQVVRLHGPAGSHAVLQHRLQGYLWDLVEGTPGRFQVTEIRRGELDTIELRSHEGFAVAHRVGTRPFDGRVHEDEDCTIDAAILDHGPSDSIGYVLRQKERRNIDARRLASAGLKPGPWLKRLLDPATPDDEPLQPGGSTTLGAARSMFVVATPDESLGYLTDFRATPASLPELRRLFSGCRWLVCENNYGDADHETAIRNNHMTSSMVGELASALEPECLVVFHLTDKHGVEGWRTQLAQVRARFPRAWYPPGWGSVFA
ncbi:MAG: MBL fold metallo-hydrolase [Planctomycetia bacterium]